MIPFVKPDITVINRVIYYSTLLRDIRITLLQLRKTMIMIRGLGLTIPSFNDLNNIEVQLIRRMQEIEAICKQLLQPLFEGINFGHEYLNHWAIPMSDVEKGYCELEEILQFKDHRPILFGRKFILLLQDYEDTTLGKFYGGELIELSKAIHFIEKIPGKVNNKKKGLYDAIRDSIELALRYRTSKTLSNE